jgi:hypothetical protein
MEKIVGPKTASKQAANPGESGKEQDKTRQNDESHGPRWRRVVFVLLSRCLKETIHQPSSQPNLHLAIRLSSLTELLGQLPSIRFEMVERLRLCRNETDCWGRRDLIPGVTGKSQSFLR